MHWGGDHGGFADPYSRSAILPLTPLRADLLLEHAYSSLAIQLRSVIRGIIVVLHVWHHWIIATRPRISAVWQTGSRPDWFSDFESSNWEKGKFLHSDFSRGRRQRRLDYNKRVESQSVVERIRVRLGMRIILIMSPSSNLAYSCYRSNVESKFHFLIIISIIESILSTRLNFTLLM